MDRERAETPRTGGRRSALPAADGDEMALENDSKALSRQRYGKYAQRYVTSKTLEIGRPDSGWEALDVATGGGHTALKFAPYAARVVATDLTVEMLRAARAHLLAQGATNVWFVAADAEDLPFRTGKLELVTCRIAPHHFPNVPRFVAECARVLKPGGRLLVQDHVLPEDEQAAQYVDAFEKLRDPSHNRAFGEAEWRALFEGAGLTVERVEQVIKRHEFLPWAERQGCTPEVIARLESMLHQAPLLAAEWLQARDVGSPAATFVNHHIIISGRNG
jgi:ubiquinone/menaquinone biosynthesis C-methylase UbiE